MSFTLAFIHTAPVVVPLFSALAHQKLEGAKVFHMVDESLIQNTVASGNLTKATIRRLVHLIGSAHEAGADAVLVTCSSIGPGIPVARSLYDFPILRVDEPMAEKAVQIGERVGVAATLRTTLEPTVNLLRQNAAEQGRHIEISESLCDGAFEKVSSGDTKGHDQIVSQALTSLARQADVIVLAQASMARVVNQLSSDVIQIPILSSPELAVEQARQLVAGLFSAPEA